MFDRYVFWGPNIYLQKPGVQETEAEGIFQVQPPAVYHFPGSGSH